MTITTNNNGISANGPGGGTDRRGWGEMCQIYDIMIMALCSANKKAPIIW